MDFLQQLASGNTLLFDGAMGSLLSSLGADMRSGHNNLCNPQIVEKAHRLYLDAGADCIITNSFSLNRVYSEMDDSQLEASLRAAMEIALKAADGKAYVFGDIGPTGKILAPVGNGTPEEFYAAYCRQISIMAQYPLTGLIAETLFHLAEAELILKAWQDTAPQLPLLLSMTYFSAKKGGLTMMGNKAVDIAKKAKEAGVVAVGCNCGDLNPADYPPIIASLKSAGLPVLLQPNAGKPILYEDGQPPEYPLTPEQFAEQMGLCHQAGAQLLGGCCGTTPQHIRLLTRYKNH